MSRLAAIKICGYRGFPHPATIWLSPHDGAGRPTGGGRNLLLYGENGSGKSSVGKALRDFLDFRSKAPQFDEYKYRFTNPPRTDRGVSLVFDDGTTDPLDWNPTSRDTAHRNFAHMARACGWIDYREIWRLTAVPMGKDSVDVFGQLVSAILPGCLPRSGARDTFGQSWERIIRRANERPTRTPYRKGEVDELLTWIESFNDSLDSFLVEIVGLCNELLKEFTPWTSVSLEWVAGASYDSGARGQKFRPGTVKLKMQDRDGAPLTSPSEFLNEARITAIGLCLYLAGMSRSVPPQRTDGSRYPRLLVLDDVLLSLDMVHRMPLLNVLKSSRFTEWQVLMLTHDRSWYEIAKQELGGDKWAHCELFARRVGDYDQPLVREDHDHLLQAIDFLEAGHVKAAAVHVRTRFEEVLKSACTRLELRVRYQPDPRRVKARDFWDAVSAATWDDIPSVRHATDSKGKLRWWQPEARATAVVPPKLKARIDHALTWVMNPLSHSQGVDGYRPEIEDAIFAVHELEQAVATALAMRQAGPVVLRQMLLGHLAARYFPSP